ncbi:MAG: hypothetical protein CMH56_14420 [Myxococcales bacterium]|nr:hypothetical protein [Myxococcales bacterium]
MQNRTAKELILPKPPAQFGGASAGWGVGGMMCLLCASACITVATALTPSPEPVSHPQTPELDQQFWKVLQSGDYEQISSVEIPIKAAYLEQPRDPVLAAKLGFLHAWRVTERARLKEVGPDITDDLSMAQRYFHAAHRLEPDNPIYHGFYAAYALADATIHDDPKRLTQAGLESRNAIRAWPEFNLFTFAYLTHALPYDDQRNADAVADLDDIIHRCIGDAPPSSASDFAQALDRSTHAPDERQRRACGNTDKVPFNIQGFMLNLGDTLVRQGDLERAQFVYETLQQTAEHAAWPFHAITETRLQNLQVNVGRFQKNPPRGTPYINPTDRAMFHSSIACVGCHQAAEAP